MQGHTGKRMPPESPVRADKPDKAPACKPPAAWWLAVADGDTKVVAALLDSNAQQSPASSRFDINAVDWRSDESALMTAARVPHVALLRALLQRGASPQAYEHGGKRHVPLVAAPTWEVRGLPCPF